MIIEKLRADKLISPPKWLEANTAFLTRMGSDAYGASSGSSDIDVYGFCIPSKTDIFPHLGGNIHGFGTQPNPFQQWTEQHIKTPDGKEYDFVVYSIVKYFDMALNASPNIIDALFTPRRCVIHSTAIGEHVRENRKLFLSKRLKHRLLGYAFAQLGKLRNGNTPFVEFVRNHRIDARVFDDGGDRYLDHLSDEEKTEFFELKEKHPIKQNESRRNDIIRHGFSTKEAYHVVRLSLQCEQVLTEGDLDLERNSEILKSIRRGEWTFDRLTDWFAEKEKTIETLYANSTIPHSPDEPAIKAVLMQCLEMHFGSLDKAVRVQTPTESIIRDLEELVARYR